MEARGGRPPQKTSLELPVLSGSMAPFLKPGGRILMDCSLPAEPRPGDIIVFHEAGRLVAHRLVLRLRLPGNCLLYQRGDSGGAGHWVREKQVIGVVQTSRDADGTLLYERAGRGAGHLLKTAPVLFADIRSWAVSWIRALVTAGTVPRRRREYVNRNRPCGFRRAAHAPGYTGLLAEYFRRPSATGAPMHTWWYT